MFEGSPIRARTVNQEVGVIGVTTWPLTNPWPSASVTPWHGKKNIEEKKMFGGVGFLLNGNLLVGVRKDSLLVRLGPEQSDEALQEAHVSEFKITGRGTMKGWVVVEP